MMMMMKRGHKNLSQMAQYSIIIVANGYCGGYQLFSSNSLTINERKSEMPHT